jgi:dipeptidyl aminopeptidase/acylaminoacyl peptidase
MTHRSSLAVSAPALLALAFLFPCAAPLGAAEIPVYRQPPQVVADVLTAPRVPRGTPSVSPDLTRMLLVDQPSLIPIATLAEPVEKLAGLEIVTALRAPRAAVKAAARGLSIVTIADGRKVRARLPEGARLGTTAWSNAGDRLACVVHAPGGAEMWIVEAASGAARRIEGVRLNTVADGRIEWTLDDRALICATVPSGQAALDEPSRVPEGPQVRVGAGRPTPQRTARDVLRTPDDQARLAWHLTAQLARVPVDGGAAQPIGAPVVLGSWSLAPDERHLLVTRLPGTPPVGFPIYLFPHDLEIWSAEGRKVASLGLAPLNDRSAISSVAPLGPRDPGWSPDGRAIFYCSWQDTPGADPVRAIRDTTLAQPGTDRLMRLDEPFTGEPREVMRSDHQILGTWWTTEGSRLIFHEEYQPRRRIQTGWIQPFAAAPSREIRVVRSRESVQSDPGRPLLRRVRHQARAWTSADGGGLYLAGDGFRKDGQRPFLDRMDLGTARTTRLFESAATHLEPVVALLGADGKRFLTLRQSNREAPNYFARRAGEKSGRRLSDYADPAPALTASQRVQFKFPRPDSVWLNAEAVLPADWKPGRALPTIFWVYPTDYRSAAAAQENRRSPNRFPSQSPLNPEVLVTQGYAVVYADIAVVGTNDRYVDEIGASARAAIEECARRGFTDPARVGVGGHSYGAFSTANLLAHTDLFKAGIASDGAYNRTLTPFTFQAEERTLWQARETYLAMSPFVHAEKINEPLLLLHNLDDTNVGTHPMQSQRMFEALNGMGKTVTLIEYPYEDHGPASRETVLDYWARVIEWFDRHVRAGAAAQAGAPGTGSP